MPKNPFADTSADAYDSKLSELNPAQLQAVKKTEGPVLILAGAGTGKTGTITVRAARLIRECDVPALRILLVTFTRAAAEEMRERLVSLTGRVGKQAKVATFHSIGLMQLMSRPSIAGLEENPKIINDTGEFAAIFNEILSDDWGAGGDLFLQIRTQVPQVFAEQENEDSCPTFCLEGVKLFLKEIEAAKNRGLTPDKYRAWIAAGSPSEEQIATAFMYPLYQQALKDANSCDFADLLLWPVLAMKSDEDLRREWASSFAYVTVDEFQDTNPIQADWLHLMVRDHGNLCVVGDDDQSLYGFRGAELSTILEFEQHYPGAECITLVNNYRSTETIITASNALIGMNQVRRAKALASVAPGGSPIGHRLHHDEHAMLDGVAISAKASLAKQATQADNQTVFILYRSNFLCRRIEKSLIRHGLSYEVVKGEGFYGTEEIRDCLAFLRLLSGIGLTAEEFHRVINKPARGLGEKSRKELEKHLFAGGLEDGFAIAPALEDLLASRGKVSPGALNKRAKAGLLDWIQCAAAYQDDRDSDDPLYGAGTRFEIFLQDIGYLAYWEAKNGDEVAAKLENISEFVGHLEECGSEADALRAAVQAIEANVPDAPIKLMTMHGSKGLEAPHVIMPFYQEGIIPSKRSLEAEAMGNDNAIEEERRLAYVGLTRARETAEYHLCGEPSRFLCEVPPDCLVDLDEKGNPIPIEKEEGQPSSPKDECPSNSQEQLAAKLYRDLTDLKERLDDKKLPHPPVLSCLSGKRLDVEELTNLLSGEADKSRFAIWSVRTGNKDLADSITGKVNLLVSLARAGNAVAEHHSNRELENV